MRSSTDSLLLAALLAALPLASSADPTSPADRLAALRAGAPKAGVTLSAPDGRRVVVEPDVGAALIVAVGPHAAPEVRWRVDRTHAWRWRPGRLGRRWAQGSLRLLPERPWREALAPYGRALAHQAIDPLADPLAWWVLGAWLNDRCVDADLLEARALREGDVALVTDGVGFRRSLSSALVADGVDGIYPPADFDWRWRLDEQGRLSGFRWRILWPAPIDPDRGGLLSAGRVTVSAWAKLPAEAGGGWVPKALVVERLRSERARAEELLSRRELRVTAALTPDAALPAPPALLSRGLPLSTEALQRRQAASPRDLHLLRRLGERSERWRGIAQQLATVIPAEARELTAARESAQGARRERMSPAAQARPASSWGDPDRARLIVAIRGSQPLPAALDGDRPLAALQLARSGGSMRELREPAFRARLRRLRCALFADPATPFALRLAVLRRLGSLGPAFAREHLAAWTEAPRSFPCQLTRLALLGYAQQAPPAALAADCAAALARLDAGHPERRALLRIGLLALPAAERAALRARLLGQLKAADVERREPLFELLASTLTVESPAAQAAGLIALEAALGTGASELITVATLRRLGAPDKLLAAPAMAKASPLLRAQLTLMAQRFREGLQLLMAEVQRGEPARAQATQALLGRALSQGHEGTPEASRHGWARLADLLDTDTARGLLKMVHGRCPSPLLLAAQAQLTPAADPALAGRALVELLAEPQGPTGLRAISQLLTCSPDAPKDKPLLPALDGLRRREPRDLPLHGELAFRAQRLASGPKQTGSLARLVWLIDRLPPTPPGATRVAPGLALLPDAVSELAPAALAELGESRGAALLRLLAAKGRDDKDARLMAIGALVTSVGNERWIAGERLELLVDRGDWVAATPLLERSLGSLPERRRRDLLVEAVRGLLASKRWTLAERLAARFAALHPRDALYSSREPLIELLKAGRRKAFDAALTPWLKGLPADEARGLRIELLSAGERPLEAFGALVEHRDKQQLPESAVKRLLGRLIEAHGKTLPFRHWCTTARFAPPEDPNRQLRMEIWVEALGSRNGARRRKAHAALIKAGQDAGKALLEGRQSDDLEVRRSCDEILQAIFRRSGALGSTPQE